MAETRPSRPGGRWLAAGAGSSRLTLLASRRSVRAARTSHGRCVASRWTPGEPCHGKSSRRSPAAAGRSGIRRHSPPVGARSVSPPRAEPRTRERAGKPHTRMVARCRDASDRRRWRIGNLRDGARRAAAGRRGQPQDPSKRRREHAACGAGPGTARGDGRPPAPRPRVESPGLVRRQGRARRSTGPADRGARTGPWRARRPRHAGRLRRMTTRTVSYIEIHKSFHHQYVGHREGVADCRHRLFLLTKRTGGLAMVDAGNASDAMCRRLRAAILAPAFGPRAFLLARPTTLPLLTTAGDPA